MPLTTTELLAFAQDLGREAGRLLKDWSGRAAATTKWDGTVVTEADHAADQYLTSEIRARYPQHEILSEEAATSYSGVPYIWVIDPLDGTNNYALGVCYWCCSIALLHQGMPLVGVITVPNLEADFWAVRGEGAFLNGERLGGPARGVSERNSFLALCSRTFRYLDLRMPQKARLLGSAAYDLAAVAQGIAVGSTQVTPHIWDIAAGWLILQEAGRAVAPLFPDAPDPFPLLPGADYKHRVFPVASGTDEGLLAAIVEGVRIKAGMESRLAGWAAAGWLR
jgi:myo-inositol-1(or 4)-monophosphatase